MPIIEPDFNEELKPITPGIYLCKIMSHEQRIGKESQRPYLNWKLLTHPEGRMVYHTTPFQGKGAGMFKHLVHCTGDTTYESGAYNTDKLNDKYVSMELDVDKRGYFTVKAVLPLTAEQQATVVAITAANDTIPF